MFSIAFIGVMRLVQGVLRSLAARKSPRCLRSLATSSASDANTTKSETMEDFKRSVFGDPSSSSFFKKLDLLKGVDERSAMDSRFSGSRREGLVDGLDDIFTSLTHGLDGKLKDVATYFEYDMNEVEKEECNILACEIRVTIELHLTIPQVKQNLPQNQKMPSTPGGIEPSFQEIPRSLPFKITSSEGSERWRARIDHKVRRRSGIATFRNFKYFLNIFFTSNVNNIDSVPDSIYCKRKS
ncbi:hypothetical protein Tco_1123366 [Tanacetum coccineum]|uniref:Uncharacterized protein n=1 Tax=Tanacetum coccineum TaxID=301880 RepID=A0ABQ5J473_9ASTR